MAEWPTIEAPAFWPRRHGDWMQTFTGKAFYPLDPRPSEVDPVDIAHALSMICRFGGHSTRFYSVAEHSVLVSYAVSPAAALWGLMHDAAEAYVGDMVRPLKRSMPAYQVTELRVIRAIADRFRLNWKCPAEVKTADTRLLVDERDALMNASILPWGSLEGIEPLGVEIVGWSPEEAKAQFLTRFAELTDGSARA
jgi:hypothetical protein